MEAGNRECSEIPGVISREDLGFTPLIIPSQFSSHRDHKLCGLTQLLPCPRDPHLLHSFPWAVYLSLLTLEHIYLTLYPTPPSLNPASNTTSLWQLNFSFLRLSWARRCFVLINSALNLVYLVICILDWCVHFQKQRLYPSFFKRSQGGEECEGSVRLPSSRGWEQAIRRSSLWKSLGRMGQIGPCKLKTSTGLEVPFPSLKPLPREGQGYTLVWLHNMNSYLSLLLCALTVPNDFLHSPGTS